MNPSIKKKWVKALRSGRYRQGKRYLRPTTTTYCCLGVICEVMHTPMSCGQVALGEVFLNECGLTRSAEAQLVFLNDTENKSFPQIADWIEENL